MSRRGIPPPPAPGAEPTDAVCLAPAASGEAVRPSLYEELTRVAHAGRTTTYRALAAHAGLDLDDAANRAALADCLRAISAAEHAVGRPLLSAVVVLGGRGLPGRGFFALARILGLHRAGDDGAFWRRELARAYIAWRTDEKPARDESAGAPRGAHRGRRSGAARASPGGAAAAGG